MTPNRYSLKMVILDCAYDTIAERNTQQLLARTVATKILGYRASYPYGVLPVDASDFVGRHALVCEETEDGYKVLCATKSITLSRCREFNMTFPMLSLAKANQAEHVGYVEKHLEDAASEKVDVLYQFSWSADPEVRLKDRDLAVQLREIILAQLVLEAQEAAPAKVMLAGVPRVKTDQFFENVGYHPAMYRGEILSSFSVPSSLGEKAVFMDFKEVTFAARALIKRYQSMWDQRMIVADPAHASKAA